MNNKIETMSPRDFYYKPKLNIKKVTTVYDCARVLKFLCDLVILPTPIDCMINDFEDVAEYFNEENNSKNTKVSFRVIDDKGNDVTNNACWVLMPDGKLVANEYGDLIGRTDVHAVFDVMEDKLTAIQWINSKIEQELSQSTTSTYKCTDGTVIKTDVGYVEEWWNEYKQHLIQSC